MSITTYGLLLVGAGVVLNGFANYFNSRKIKYLQEQQMAGKTELRAALDAHNQAILDERDEVKAALEEQAEKIKELVEAAQNGEDLSEFVTAVNESTGTVQGIYDKPAPVIEITPEPETDGETVTDPATDVVAEPEAEVTDGE